MSSSRFHQNLLALLQVIRGWNLIKVCFRHNRTVFLSGIVLVIILQFLLEGCSRYAPVPQIPRRKVLRISLTTRENVGSDVYYYIAMEFPPDNDGEGPRAILSRERSGEDWTYYIRLFDYQFTEKFIKTRPQDLDALPDPFGSSRLYDSYVSGKYIQVDIYLDELIKPLPVPDEIWLNFITSRAPLTSAAVNVRVIDALKSPGLMIRTSQVGQLISNDQYPNIDSPDLTDEGDFPADIVSWWLRIDEI